METKIFIVEVTYFNRNNQVISKDFTGVFTEEENARGYCNLMNKLEQNWLYTYYETEICTRDFKKYA